MYKVLRDMSFLDKIEIIKTKKNGPIAIRLLFNLQASIEKNKIMQELTELCVIESKKTISLELKFIVSFDRDFTYHCLKNCITNESNIDTKVIFEIIKKNGRPDNTVSDLVYMFLSFKNNFFL
jgi:hypothetical protein